MTEYTNEPSKKPFADSESALGGADAVEKTSYVVGKGTDPEARAPADHPPSVGHTGTNPILWIVIGVAVIIGAVYFLGIAVH
ncbi:MAG: hypothetical protein ACR2GG_01165 [Gemmatimonadaceae bacterium]